MSPSDRRRRDVDDRTTTESRRPTCIDVARVLHQILYVATSRLIIPTGSTAVARGNMRSSVGHVWSRTARRKVDTYVRSTPAPGGTDSGKRTHGRILKSRRSGYGRSDVVAITCTHVRQLRPPPAQQCRPSPSNGEGSTCTIMTVVACAPLCTESHVGLF
jgi:hypothetical protein